LAIDTKPRQMFAGRVLLLCQSVEHKVHMFHAGSLSQCSLLGQETISKILILLTRLAVM